MKVYVVESYEPGRDTFVFDSVFDSEEKAKEYCDKHNPKRPPALEYLGPECSYIEVELE